MIRSRFKLPAEGSQSSGSTRVLNVDVAPERKDDVAEALRDLIGRLSDHPGIIPLIDADIADDGRPFIVTAQVPGDSLDVALSVYGPAAIADALPRLQQLADALDHAATRGMCHGALEPRDICVSADDTRIVGMGVATALRSAGDISSPVTAYTAPEMVHGTEPSPAADQYSLAVIAHEWLFGRRIGANASGVAVLGQPGVNAQVLKRAFATATATDPAERFASCSEFVRALADSTKVVELVAPVAEELPLRAAADSVPLTASRVPAATPTGYGMGALAAALVIGLVAGAGAVWTYLATGTDRAVITGTLRPDSVPANNSAQDVTEGVVNPPRDDMAAARTPAITDAARASQADAGLLVHSTPSGAIVTVDGVPRGSTPVAVRALELGAHQVVISRPGYRSVDRQVQLTAERPSRTLEIELSPTTAYPAARTVPTTGAASAATAGSLVIESRPSGATVTVDGRASGVTPLTLTTIAPGRHTVRMEHVGHRSVTTTVDVKAGERVRVAARLEEGQDEE